MCSEFCSEVYLITVQIKSIFLRYRDKCYYDFSIEC